MKSTYRLVIPWWHPFVYFAPAMGLFLLYPLMETPWINQTIDFVIVFSFATINFIIGVAVLYRYQIKIRQNEVIIYQGFYKIKIPIKKVIVHLDTIENYPWQIHFQVHHRQFVHCHLVRHADYEKIKLWFASSKENKHA
jgi:hypothetical protein